MASRYIKTRFAVHQFYGEAHRLLGGLADRAGGLWPPFGRSQPVVNILEDSDMLIVEVELPGLKAEQIDVSVGGSELSIKTNCPEDNAEGTEYRRRERSRGALQRMLPLPFGVDTTKVEAEFSNGLLTVFLPKAEDAKSRKVGITSK